MKQLICAADEKTVLVNALGVTNQSGLHVLAGHLEQLLGMLAGECRFVVLARESMADFRSRIDGRVEWVVAPEKTSVWWFRNAWEYRHLRRIAEQVDARIYFTPSGIAAVSLNIKQVVYCMNPWPLVSLERRRTDALKAWLQRFAYRRTMKQADVMVFLSRFMQRVYRENAGIDERHGVIAYTGTDEETRQRATAWQGGSRVQGQIVCVSVMAPHKNVETVIRAVVRLPVGATLRLAGGWPDAAYEKKIRKLVDDLGLVDRVFFDGFVPREALDRLYAQSSVFCLMSRCESFGIPAVEAQLFGTPVVCSNVCAVPEVCGEGGLFYDPDDVAGVAAALDMLLHDPGQWKIYSEKALLNTKRFQWQRCSQGLADVFRAG